MKAEFNLHREQANRLFCRTIENSKTPYHFHSQIEIYLVHAGELEVWINDRREILKAGEISVALSFDPHGYRTISPSKVTCLIIPTDLCGEFSRAVQNKQLESPFLRNKTLYEALNRHCEEIMAGCNEIKRQGCIYMILGLLLEQMQPKEQKETVDTAPATRILFYINEHYKSPLTLQSIAADLGYNASYLSRCFKDCFHMGINHYITLMRLRTAVLLMQKKKNIAACAYESGFNSVRTFYRSFFEEFQCTPKEYLKNLTSDFAKVK